MYDSECEPKHIQTGKQDRGAHDHFRDRRRFSAVLATLALPDKALRCSRRNDQRTAHFATQPPHSARFRMPMHFFAMLFPPAIQGNIESR